jgi:hypothetical protein
MNSMQQTRLSSGAQHSPSPSPRPPLTRNASDVDAPSSLAPAACLAPPKHPATVWQSAQHGQKMANTPDMAPVTVATVDRHAPHSTSHPIFYFQSHPPCQLRRETLQSILPDAHCHPPRRSANKVLPAANQSPHLSSVGTDCQLISLRQRPVRTNTPCHPHHSLRTTDCRKPPRSTANAVRSAASFLRL